MIVVVIVDGVHYESQNFGRGREELLTDLEQKSFKNMSYHNIHFKDIREFSDPNHGLQNWSKL